MAQYLYTTAPSAHSPSKHLKWKKGKVVTVQVSTAMVFGACIWARGGKATKHNLEETGVFQAGVPAPQASATAGGNALSLQAASPGHKHT